MLKHIKQNSLIYGKKLLIVIALVLLASIWSAVSISRKIYTKFFIRQVTSATLHTNMGNITFKFRDNAPKATENFISLVKSGFYDKTKIHRVVPNTLIEGGDPLSKFDSVRDKWGKGGPGYVFPDEIEEGDKMVKGVVAMVNTGPDTNGSQFFILSTDTMWLNGMHTIFGDVIMGQDVVENIASVPVGVTGMPASDIIITSIELK